MTGILKMIVLAGGYGVTACAQTSSGLKHRLKLWKDGYDEGRY
jgi:hypothetical protein